MKINQYTSASTITTPTRTEDRRSSSAARTSHGATVSISTGARQLEEAREKLANQGDIREEKVQEARLALANGSLHSEAALDELLDRLIPDLL